MPIRRSLTFILTILNQLGKIKIRLENEVYCMRISKSEVIATASKIADENGLHNVSLKIVAERLKIKVLVNQCVDIDLKRHQLIATDILHAMPVTIVPDCT